MCGTCGNLAHDDLDDDIGDIFGTGQMSTEDAARAAEFAKAVSDNTRPAAGPVLYWDTCGSCRGSGNFITYSGRVGGACFKCKGKGQVPFKTSPEKRAADAERKRKNLATKLEAFVTAHADEWAWIATEAPKFDFAKSMFDKLLKDGELTPGQLAAVQKLIAREQARTEAEAAQKEAAPVIEEASLAKIEEAFAAAIARDIARPKLRLDTFMFSPARSGVNAGSIYVKHLTETNRDGEKRYLGKITDGKFLKSWGCTPEEEQRIIAAAMAPLAAATAYGRREGRCSFCGRKLTKSESIDRAIGPICAENLGW